MAFNTNYPFLWNGGIRQVEVDVVCPHCGEKAGTKWVAEHYIDSGTSSQMFTGQWADAWNEA